MDIHPLFWNLQKNDEEITGLGQAEAEARYVDGQDNSLAFKEGRSKQDIVLEAIFNVYTFDLVGVAVVFFLLNQPLSAFFSLVIMVLIFYWNISQAFKAKDRLDLQIEQTKPEASVIRDGKLRAIDFN